MLRGGGLESKPEPREGCWGGAEAPATLAPHSGPLAPKRPPRSTPGAAPPVASEDKAREAIGCLGAPSQSVQGPTPTPGRGSGASSLHPQDE